MRNDLALLADEYLNGKSKKRARKRDFQRNWAKYEKVLEASLSADESVTYLECVSSGYIVLTSKRLILTGHEVSFSIPTSDIVSASVETASPWSYVHVLIRGGKTRDFAFWQDQDGAREFNRTLAPIILRG